MEHLEVIKMVNFTLLIFCCNNGLKKERERERIHRQMSLGEPRLSNC